jgi:hypothetical protein
MMQEQHLQLEPPLVVPGGGGGGGGGGMPSPNSQHHFVGVPPLLHHHHHHLQLPLPPPPSEHMINTIERGGSSPQQSSPWPQLENTANFLNGSAPLPPPPPHTPVSSAQQSGHHSPNSILEVTSSSVGVGNGGQNGGPNSTSNSKKSSSRRNAWGNLSYADLITQAIESVPEKRLTLSQVYEWMVQNIPYFKDKGDSNSSAGWKVGRHIRGIFMHVRTLPRATMTVGSMYIKALFYAVYLI